MTDPRDAKVPDRPMTGSADEDLRRVGARMDAEVRADAADAERMALRTHLRSRHLADVARQLLVRGDRVELSTGAASARGRLIHAAGDLAIVRTDRDAVLDVRLGGQVWIRVVHRMREGGVARTTGSQTFRARMTTHEIAGSAVEITATDGRTATGVLAAVARDHLWLSGSTGDVAVPLEAVFAVAVADDGQVNR